MIQVTDLRTEVRAVSSLVERRTGEFDSLMRSKGQLTERIEQLTGLRLDLETAAGILNRIGDERQAGVQKQIEQVVTSGLQTVFDENLSFHMVTETKGKTVTTSFLIRTSLPDGSVVDTPVMDARGGGVAVTVGFLLRVVLTLLSNRGKSVVMLLDETFAHVSAEYEPRLAEFIRDLVDRTGLQILLVTHSTAFNDHADVVYRFRLGTDGHTVVVRE